MAARVPVLVVFLVLSCWCLEDFCSLAQKLPTREVDALKKIAGKLKVGSAWDFSVDPCKGSGGWSKYDTSTRLGSNLTCSCNTTTNICHVVSIWLKGMNLTGVLPEEFRNLSSLTDIDLTYNYINGSIPAAAWASLPLVHLSLIGNRISGTIPKEIGAIRTLQELILDDNQLQGSIPRELGNLLDLTRLLVSGNNLGGKLPDTMGNLKNLSDLRIDGNDFSGRIPTFIGNWTKLQRFDMQGTSLEGPFPSIFSTLEGITELRVSDLLRPDGSFPPLQSMSKMSFLVLRNCSISSEIPEYIGKMKLKILDLSFNSLRGKIPDNFGQLPLSYMYLTNNMLNGPIPTWILESKQSFDVSHNTFTESPPSNCQEGNVNMVASYSSTESNSVASCLRKDLPCSGKATNYEFFINCGGNKVTVDDREYEDDSSPRGSSNFFLSDSRKWAYSSTGSFVSNDRAKYVASNTTVLNMPDPELYESARLSPASLRYYGLCLQKGNYTVQLHFAEIMFTDDQTYASVGKRLFDVSIQGQKVLKDFNIAEAANGTGRVITKPFMVLVNGTTLEIHFQWGGKGTSLIPSIGVYGPLISAISVTPNFKPDMGDTNLSLGAILGIVAASSVMIVLTSLLLWFCFRGKGDENNEFKGLELQTARFSLKQIKAATRNFDPANKIGEGGFGPVYKGILPDGAIIAIKQLSSKSKQGNREFLNEIGMISALQHQNLVKLFGFCVEGNQLLLIYEYMENNNLACALFGPEGKRLKLDWQTRRKICMGVARGLAFLHEESRLKIVHRDIKATNILLDKDLNAKISDFGLAKLDEEENTHISTRIAGTMGYMAPEYATRGYLTDKADVYSFGVVLLEIVSGMSNTNYRPKEDFVYLLDWAYVLQERGSLLELVDPNLGTSYPKEEAQQTLNLALVCTNPSPTLRPKMTTVVSMLEGRRPVRVPSVKLSRSESEDLRFKAFERLAHDSQTRSISVMDGPWIDSSLSLNSGGGDSTSLSTTSKLLSDSTDQSV